MPKGIPWKKEEVDRLLDLRAEGKTVAEIAVRMKKSGQSITKKLDRLGFKVVSLEKSSDTTTSELILPKELLTVEEALKVFVAAMKALEVPGLSKPEIMRLRNLIMATKAYRHEVAEYNDYRRIERELVQLNEELHELRKREEEKARKPRISPTAVNLKSSG
jgi:hypothetical protein